MVAVISQSPPAKKKVKSKGKQYLEGVFSVNTSMCRSELELIQFVIQKNGFMETQNAGAGNLFWFGLALTDKDIKLINKKNFYYNRYPGMEVLARKKLWCSISNFGARPATLVLDQKLWCSGCKLGDFC